MRTNDEITAEMHKLNETVLPVEHKSYVTLQNILEVLLDIRDLIIVSPKKPVSKKAKEEGA